MKKAIILIFAMAVLISCERTYDRTFCLIVEPGNSRCECIFDDEISSSEIKQSKLITIDRDTILFCNVRFSIETPAEKYSTLGKHRQLTLRRISGDSEIIAYQPYHIYVKYDDNTYKVRDLINRVLVRGDTSLMTKKELFELLKGISDKEYRLNIGEESIEIPIEYTD